MFLDPTTGSLWLTYGSYFGYIRLVELNPKTGKRLYPERKPVDIAINSEASIMIFREGLVLPAGHPRVVLRRCEFVSTTSAWAGPGK